MLEHHKQRNEWARNESEELKANKEAYEVVLGEERLLLEQERQQFFHKYKQVQEQCQREQDEMEQASRRLSMLI